MSMSALRTKVILVISAVAFVVMALMYLYTETTARNDLLEEKFNALRALREIKADQIEHYLASIENQVRTFSENKMVVTALKEFSEGFEQSGSMIARDDLNEIEQSLAEYYQNEFITRLAPNIEKEVHVGELAPMDERAMILQYEYISANPNSVGEKERLFRGESELVYNSVHEEYHALFRSYQESFG